MATFTRQELNALLQKKPSLLPVGGIPAGKPKRAPAPALDGHPAEQPKSLRRVVVSIVQFRARALDAHDNMRSACKPLVDAIAFSLKVSDNDPRITWQYAQIETKGRQGVSVTIESIEQ